MIDRAGILSGLLADPGRAAVVPRDEAVALLAALSVLQVALLQAACRPTETQPRTTAPPAEDQLLNVNAAAELLAVSPRWLYRHAKTLPFTRPISPKIVRFSRAGIVRWLGTRRT